MAGILGKGLLWAVTTALTTTATVAVCLEDSQHSIFSSSPTSSLLPPSLRTARLCIHQEWLEASCLWDDGGIWSTVWCTSRRIWVQVPNTNMKAGCINKQQDSQCIVKGGGGNRKISGVLLNWWAIGLGRDTVSKYTVESEGDTQLCRLYLVLEHVHMCTHILMSTHTHEYIHTHPHHTPTLTVSWVWRGMPVIPVLWNLRQKDYDF